MRNDEGSKVSNYIGQLKLKSLDGKYRLTDITDNSGMFRIIESIPSKNDESIKQWLARLGLLKELKEFKREKN